MENRFMRRAIELSIENVRSGLGGPFAALVVKDGEILATGTNVVTTTCDPTAHAEVVAISRSLPQARALHGQALHAACPPCA